MSRHRDSCRLTDDFILVSYMYDGTECQEGTGIILFYAGAFLPPERTGNGGRRR